MNHITVYENLACKKLPNAKFKSSLILFIFFFYVLEYSFDKSNVNELTFPI